MAVVFEPEGVFVEDGWGPSHPNFTLESRLRALNVLNGLREIAASGRSTVVPPGTSLNKLPSGAPLSTNRPSSYEPGNITIHHREGGALVSVVDGDGSSRSIGVGERGSDVDAVLVTERHWCSERSAFGHRVMAVVFDDYDGLFGRTADSSSPRVQFV